MGEDLEREQRKYYCKSERKNGVGKGRRRVKIFRLFFKMGKITAIIKLRYVIKSYTFGKNSNKADTI